MELVSSLAAPAKPATVALLPGSFNPVTTAHMEIAAAALAHCDIVLFVLPRAFPHKDWAGATFEQRVEMLRRAMASEPRFAIAVADRGLYIEMAEEAQALWPEARIELICGRDAAERIANWDYGQPGVFERMMATFGLLVVPRGGSFACPGARELRLATDCNEISATEVRRRVSAGADWQGLVPGVVEDMVARIYG